MFKGRLRSINPKEKFVGSKGSLMGKIRSISGESNAVFGAVG